MNRRTKILYSDSEKSEQKSEGTNERQLKRSPLQKEVIRRKDAAMEQAKNDTKNLEERC